MTSNISRRVSQFLALPMIVLIGSSSLLQIGCTSQPRYELEQVRMQRNLQYFDDAVNGEGRPRDDYLRGAMLTGFIGNILIDKATGETWLFVPSLNPEEARWQRLPRVDKADAR